MSKPQRYSLPQGQTFRPFGMGIVISNANITDEMVESLLKTNPEARKVFIDAEAKPEGRQPKDLSPLEELTKEELRAKYAELTGKNADNKLSKAELVDAVQYEIDAAALLG